ncbi:hypothetical protein HYX00_03040 [Candidatus Woesearchaeota archaeon]|nr:hypothetical protein [Candidatus Woesearchaeota archaeon]
MFKKAITLAIALFCLVGYVYAIGESLTLDTSLNRQSINPSQRNSINNLAEYSSREGENYLEWRYTLTNNEPLNTNVCVYIGDYNRHIYIDVRSINDNLNNYPLGQFLSPINGEITHYTFQGSETPGIYNLTIQLKPTNVPCSYPDGRIDSGTYIKQRANYLRVSGGTSANTPPQYSINDIIEHNCDSPLSCDYYFVFVPIGWSNYQAFKQKAREQAIFFQDISKFKFRRVGFVYVPIYYVNSNCDVANLNADGPNIQEIFNRNTGFYDPPELLDDLQKIKDCSDDYMRPYGKSYDRVIGLSNNVNVNTPVEGFTSFRHKAIYARWQSHDTVAHELGHTYDLCDEYNYVYYEIEDNDLRIKFGITCKNRFPDNCPRSSALCQGNPTFRDYSGYLQIEGLCVRYAHYSIMGSAYLLNRCGYDNTGGYEAVG